MLYTACECASYFDLPLLRLSIYIPHCVAYICVCIYIYLATVCLLWWRLKKKKKKNLLWDDTACLKHEGHIEQGVLEKLEWSVSLCFSSLNHITMKFRFCHPWGSNTTVSSIFSAAIRPHALHERVASSKGTGTHERFDTLINVRLWPPSGKYCVNSIDWPPHQNRDSSFGHTLCEQHRLTATPK